MKEERKRVRLSVIAAATSLAVGFSLMGVKFWAYFETGSAAILSDALESIINVAAGAFALISVIVAAAPPDRNHPYGHGKIEYYAAGFEGSLIMLAAFGIIWESWDKMLHPKPLPNLDFGILLLAAAGAVNLFLGVGLVRAGKKTGSITLVADGKHVLTDVYTSAGVLVGLGLVYFTDWLWLDAGVACLVALNIIYTGYKLLRESFAGLMHETDPALIEEICLAIEEKRSRNWLDVHNLRAWRSGRQAHMDFHLILPRDMSLVAAHDEVRALEDILRERFGQDADVLIHADPCRSSECPVCAESACDSRAAVFDGERPVEAGTSCATGLADPDD